MLAASGGHFTGVITEIARLAAPVPVSLRADVTGTVDGSSVAFRKTYDGSGGWRHTVSYTGQLSADGEEISGTWRVPGLRGTFLMVRAIEQTVEAFVATEEIARH